MTHFLVHLIGSRAGVHWKVVSNDQLDSVVDEYLDLAYKNIDKNILIYIYPNGDYKKVFNRTPGTHNLRGCGGCQLIIETLDLL